MSTPHNNAEKGDFAKTVLMPGDPLRAEFIAEHFLENPKLVSSVRNILAYTGTYEGKPVSVMASGMGMPSIGIYSYELYKFYEVENIIRIGSVVLATGSYSESTFALCQSGDPDDTQYPSEKLNDTIRAAAAKLGIPLHEGTIHSGDVFYAEPGAVDENKIIREKHCLCAEMESFALFHNAKVLGKNAACLLTISDSLVTHAETTAEERQNSFTQMMKVALETAVQLDQE